MARDVSERLRDALRRVIAGDPVALPYLSAMDHNDLRALADMGDASVVVTRSAVISVLDGLASGSVTPEQAQAWASFVRCGYVANNGRGPVRPLNIVYDDAWEDVIVEAASRLDQLGDEIDGVLDPGNSRNFVCCFGGNDEVWVSRPAGLVAV